MATDLNSNLILDEVEKFHIKLANGVSFWAPYLANLYNRSQDPNVPRGLGKTSPEELKRSADYIVSLYPGSTAEEIRQKLVEGSLPKKEFNYKGVDCSGFVYHVMHAIYQKVLNKELMDDLSVPKKDVLNGALKFDEWKSAYPLSDQEAKELPDDVPLRWVVETFKRNPVNLCRVAGLISDYSSVDIPVPDMRPGDLVDIEGRGDYKFHVAIICGFDSKTVTIAHSTRIDPSDIGGVTFEKIPYDKNKIDTEQMRSPCGFKAIRRLKSLSI